MKAGRAPLDGARWLREAHARATADKTSVTVTRCQHAESRRRKDWGNPVDVDSELSDVTANFYDALVLPGGRMSPDTLRQSPEAMQLIKDFLAQGKVVAAICHAPWLLIEANAVRGRKVTSYASIKTDLVNAGANWVDEPAVADEGIVTSRAPGDLDAFVAKIIEEIEEGKQDRAILAA